jgi:hypothetical protein
MRLCWREGVVPLLQMHDSLDLSVSSPDVAEMVARLGEEVIKLEVPMKVDIAYGRNWGDAKHSWAELTGSHVEPAGEMSGAPERAARESPNLFNDYGAEPDLTPATVNVETIAVVSATPELASAIANFASPRSEPPPISRLNGGCGGYPHSEHASGTKVDEFVYRDLRGAPYLRVDKYRTAEGKKAFPQYIWKNGDWVKGKPKDYPPIPYRLPELLAAPPGSTVEVCEGEKDAITLATLGLIATTNPGGAGKWSPALNKWFAGFARANVFEDNDAAGHEHAAKVAHELRGVIPDVRVIRFHDLPENGDVSDWLKAGGTLEQLRARTDAAPPFSALASVGADDVEIEDYDWVWPGRFALKKIGLIVGLPDEGKGLTVSDILSRITRGAPWPCGEGQAPIGNAALLSAEDDIADTIVPRLIAAGADLERVTILKMMREGDGDRMFSLITDLGALRQKIAEIGDVKMVVIDPISAYLGIGKVDSFRQTDVRAILSPIKELAEELRIAVLGIMHFNKKIDVTNVLLRISDSLAYGAASRHVYAVINDPDNHRRLFVKGKNNLARYAQPTLAFEIDEREVGTDKRTGLAIRRPFVTWQDEPVDITATEALTAAAGNKSPSARDEAKQFLETLFVNNEPIPSKEMHAAARENGIAVRTLRRAAKDLGVEIKHDGAPNEKGEITWRWHPPQKD